MARYTIDGNEYVDAETSDALLDRISELQDIERSMRESNNRLREAVSKAEQRELAALAELDETRAELTNLRATGQLCTAEERAQLKQLTESNDSTESRE